MVMEKVQVEAIFCTSAFPQRNWGNKVCSYKLRSAVDMPVHSCAIEMSVNCTTINSRANPKSSTTRLLPISSHHSPQESSVPAQLVSPTSGDYIFQHHYHLCLPLPFSGSPLPNHSPQDFLLPLLIQSLHSIINICIYIQMHIHFQHLTSISTFNIYIYIQHPMSTSTANIYTHIHI